MSLNKCFTTWVAVATLLALGATGCEKQGIGAAVCDVDGFCDTAAGETYSNCPQDCTAPPVCNHDGICGPGETSTNCPDDCFQPQVCNYNNLCEPALGENSYNCPDCGVPPDCNFDGYCDVPTENIINCPSDCSPSCDLWTMTGTRHNMIVSELFLPDTSTSAAENGIDLDGDGHIDNKLGQVIQLLVQNGLEGDINDELNSALQSGQMVLLGRLSESGHGDDIVGVQLAAGLPMPAPAFDGSDQATVDPSSPTDLYLCGNWLPPQLVTTPSTIQLSLPLPGLGTLPLMLSHARVETVVDPQNPFYASSAVQGGTWHNVMVGGGLTREEIRNSLIPVLTVLLNNLVQQGGSTADTITELFDGNCVNLNDVVGCENVVPGQGACDDSANPAVITETEVLCNALLASALAPDVDVDFDGEDDLLSVGLRVVHAVTANVQGW